jgi:hypothetical protein
MTRPARAVRARPSLRTYLTEDHARLADLVEGLIPAIEADAPEARSLWSELDRGVLAHLEAEERFVLPAFARFDRDEALALLREHGQIREQLLELGVAQDLHQLRLDRSRQFIATLRAHAAREDEVMYRWADRELGASLAAATREHLAAS